MTALKFAYANAFYKIIEITHVQFPVNWNAVTTDKGQGIPNEHEIKYILKLLILD